MGFCALYNIVILHQSIVGLEINFEDSDYSSTEGSGLRTPITMQFRNNQNPFTIIFSPVTIATAEGKGVGNFINSDTIEEEARATAGGVMVMGCDCI